MEHKRHECNKDSCNICRGGLFDCEVCGGAEAALPSKCPGVRMTAEYLEQVRAGRLDYNGSHWIAVDILGEWIVRPRG